MSEDDKWNLCVCVCVCKCGKQCQAPEIIHMHTHTHIHTHTASVLSPMSLTTVCFENTDQIGIRQYHDRTRLVEDTYSKHTYTHTSRFHSSRQTCLLDAQMSPVYRSQNRHLDR